MKRSANRQRKNVTLRQRRTSVSLEQQIWDGIKDICLREAMSVDELCRAVETRRVGSSMSSALRIFLLTYFRHIVEEFEEGPPPHQPPSHQQIIHPDTPAPNVLEAALERFHVEQKAAAESV